MVFAWYRPPSEMIDIFEHLEKCLEIFDGEDKKSFL